jgi:hypothetical protein
VRSKEGGQEEKKGEIVTGKGEGGEGVEEIWMGKREKRGRGEKRGLGRGERERPERGRWLKRGRRRKGKGRERDGWESEKRG